MNRSRVLGLGCILKKIENFDISSFSGRLTFQKTVYLLQAFGLFLGYHFHWYLRGPYSVELARDGFEVEKTYGTLPDGRFTDHENEERFKKFQDFISDYRNNPKMLEALASIHFLKRIYKQRDKRGIFEEVMKKNACISHDDCQESWDHLLEYELIEGE